MKIEDALIVDPVEGETIGRVEIEGDRISSVSHSFADDYDLIVLPGFFDPHTHGAIGIDTMDLNEQALQEWEHFLFSQGVTSFLPTTVSAANEVIVSAGSLIERYIEDNPLTAVRGVHYEGPYISRERKGAQNPSFIRDVDADALKSFPLSKCSLITLAPEVEGFSGALSYLKERGVLVTAGHTNATYKQMQKAYKAGCHRMTHFPNGMRGLHHREIGCVGAGLALPFMLELISDGIHSVPEFVKLVFSIKGPDRLALVTDSMSAAGLSDGHYDLGGLDVRVSNGRATLSDGTLAGSTLLFSEGVRRFRSYTDCSLSQLAKVSSYNSVSELGLPNRGRITGGYIADLVIMNKELEVTRTILSGQVVYDAA